jgi:hypothetical protein
VRQKAIAAGVTLTKRPAGSLNATKNLMRDIEWILAQISAEADLFMERLKTPEARERLPRLRNAGRRTLQTCPPDLRPRRLCANW